MGARKLWPLLRNSGENSRFWSFIVSKDGCRAAQSGKLLPNFGVLSASIIKAMMEAPIKQKCPPLDSNLSHLNPLQMFFKVRFNMTPLWRLCDVPLSGKLFSPSCSTQISVRFLYVLACYMIRQSHPQIQTSWEYKAKSTNYKVFVLLSPASSSFLSLQCASSQRRSQTLSLRPSPTVI
jgi:hypothetical protein